MKSIDLNMENIKSRVSPVVSPLLTIIIVVFNALDTIEKTIQNILNLDYPNLDYIVIDGGSNDGTADVIEKYSSHLKYWVSEPDKGIYDAMNKGWAAADDNSFILILGSGDKVLELPRSFHLEPNTVYYGNALLGDKKVFKGKHNWRLKFGNTLHHQALIIPKSLALTPPFDTKYKVYSDFDFNQRLYKQGHRFVRLENFVSYVMPAGFSQQYKTSEWLKIISINYGLGFSIIGYLFYFYQKIKNYRQ